MLHTDDAGIIWINRYKPCKVNLSFKINLYVKFYRNLNNQR